MNETTGELTIFCKNVLLLRQKYGYSQERMAQICGIKKNTLTKIEQITMPPRLSIHVVSNICWHFRLEPYQLFLPLKLPEEQ